MNKLITNWKLIGALLLVFVSGALCGSLGTLAVLKKKFQQTRNNDYVSGVWMNRLESKLELTPEQKAELEPLIQSALEEIQEKRRWAWTDIQDILGSTDGEILSRLNPEQKTRYEELKQQRGQRIKKWLEEK